MQLGANPATTPTRIIRDAEQRTVRIPWADGHESVYDWEYLRRSCRCANCHGEGGEATRIVVDSRTADH